MKIEPSSSIVQHLTVRRVRAWSDRPWGLCCFCWPYSARQQGPQVGPLGVKPRTRYGAARSPGADP